MRGIAALALGFLLMAGNARAQTGPNYLAEGEVTRPPIGWVEFCKGHPRECSIEAIQVRRVELTGNLFLELELINRHVNGRIRPMTDLEQYGVIERWVYPESGYGDCEDYVLLKRRMLIQLGWSRSALFITTVTDQRGDGHAVLMVRTNQGDFVLDNQVEEILPWHKTKYPKFVKRQSSADPNTWVALAPQYIGSIK